MSHFKHAFRQLILRPGLSLTVIVMLALGIGATTAIFSVYHQILVRPLPIPEPERLVNLGAPGPKYGPSMGGAIGGYDALFTYEMFRDLEAEQTVFTGIAGHTDFPATLTNDAQTSSGRGALVSGSYFGVLNLKPALGRLIQPQDEPQIGETAVVVLSYDYWQNQFGGDRDVLGRTLTVNGRPVTIVGVAPEGFSGTALGYRPQVFVPLSLRWVMQPTTPRGEAQRNAYWVYLFARLAPGVAVAEASTALNLIYGRILREVESPLLTLLPDDERQRFEAHQISFAPGARGQSAIPTPTDRPLTFLLGITAVVLLIVCVNVANLLLARGAARAGELAIRASVGASRGRLIRQLLTEAGVLAALGGIASLAVALGTLAVIAAVIPPEIGAGLPIELSPTAVLFAAAATIATVLLFGIGPAWQATSGRFGQLVRGQASQTAGGRGMARFRAALITAQIAFSLVLLVLAGLFARSLVNVARVDLGMDVESLVTFSVSPRRSGYGPEETNALYDRIEEALAAQPGIGRVASSVIPLFENSAMGYQVSGPGFEWVPGRTNNFSQSNGVSPGFIRTLEMSLRAGRDFTPADRAGAPRVAIVNEAFVRRFGLGDEVVGTHFSLPFVIDDLEIVGVVADAKYDRVKDEVQPQVFTPRAQSTNLPTLTFFVRGAIGADAIAATVRRVVAEIAPAVPVENLAPMREQVKSNVYLDRMVTLLSTSFAGLATLLAAIGLYGVLAYNVAQRTRELGLRLALGARPAQLRAMVLKQVGAMTLVGVVVGIGAALALGRAAEALLFGLSGYDPVVLVGAAMGLATVVLAASYLPARRASHTSPMQALRYE
jgi:predicted permease